MDIEDYLKIQNDEFIDFIKDPKKIILVATESAESLKSFYEYYNGQVEEYKNKKSYVVKRSDGLHELFILGSDGSYKEKFRAFLTDYYHIPQDYVLDENLHVDHVFNKKRAEDYFIRMILLDKSANRAWGQSYEKVSSRLDRESGVKRKQHILLDYTVILKILEFEPFLKGNIKDKSDIEKIAETTFDKLSALAGPDALIESVRTFYRNENNRLVNEVWIDPSHIEVEEIVFDVDSVMDLAKFLEKMIEGYPIDFLTEDIDGNYIALNSDVQTQCFEILTKLFDLTEIDWVVHVKNKVLTSMVIGLYYANKEALRYVLELKRV